MEDYRFGYLAVNARALDRGVFHVTADATLGGIWVRHGDEAGFLADVKFVSRFAAAQFATEDAGV
jgi:hypothetical protein